LARGRDGRESLGVERLGRGSAKASSPDVTRTRPLFANCWIELINVDSPPWINYYGTVAIAKSGITTVGKLQPPKPTPPKKAATCLDERMWLYMRL